MTDFYLAVAAFLLLTIFLGLWRVLRGPASADRMMAAQLFGTTGLATVLLVGTASGQAAAVDIALIFALLAALSTVAFVRCARRIPPTARSRNR